MPTRLIEIPRRDQRFDETLKQQHVRIQGQNPFGGGKRDGLVLRGRKSNVFFVIDDSATVFEGLQDIDGPVRGVIVDNNNLLERIILIKDGFEAALDKAAAVIGNDRYRNEVATGHVRAGRLHSSDFTSL